MFLRSTFLCILAVTLSTTLAAQTYVTAYRADFGEQPAAHIALPDGSSVVASMANFDVEIHTSLMRVDRFGQVLWHHVYDRTDFDIPAALIHASDDTIVCVGTSDRSPWMFKVTVDDGALLLSQTVDVEGSFEGLCEDSLGRLVAVGSDRDNVLLVDFATDGTLIKVHNFGFGLASEVARDVVAGDDGSVTVAAWTNAIETTGGGDLWVLSLDSDRDVRWGRTIGRPDTTTGITAAIDRATSGGYFVSSGNNFGGPEGDHHLLVRVSEDGDLVFAMNYDDGSDIARDVEATEDDGCLLLGDSSFGGAPRLVLLVKVAADGSMEWSQELGTSVEEHFGFALDRTSFGGILVAATLPHQTRVGHTSTWLLRLEPDGVIEVDCPLVNPANAEAFSSDIPILSPRNGRSSREFLSDDAPLQIAEVTAGLDSACESCFVNFSGFGQGLEGSGGFVPALSGERGSCDGSTPRVLQVQDGLGGAFGVLFVNLRDAELAFMGGTLYIDPAGWLTIPLTLQGIPGVAGDGGLLLQGTSDLGAFVGLPLYLQTFFADPAAIRGVSMSNALRMVVGN